MTTSSSPAAASGEFLLGGDLPVFRMGFGAMRVTGRGIWGPPADKDRARQVLKKTLDLGINFIDTADSYGPFVSEELIAEALQPAERDFIGRKAIEAQREAGAKHKLVGLLLEDRGVLRNHQKVVTGDGEGEITSGSFSPTLQRAIAFARVPKQTGETCQVDIRGKLLNARVVKPPFVRNGVAQIDL